MKRTGSSGTKPNISIDTTQGVYYCWRCRARGALTQYKAKLLHVKFDSNSIKDLGVFDPLVVDTPVKQERKDLPEGAVPLYPWKNVKRSVSLRRYIHFLRCRHVTPRLVESFKLHAYAGKVYNRTIHYIVYPLMDKIEGYVLRSLDGPYRNMPGLNGVGALYNGRILSHPKVSRVYVVEGPHDVLALWGHAVGTLGTSFSEQQLDRLASYPGKLYSAYDGDATHIGRSLVGQLLLRGKHVNLLELPPAKDPGNIGLSGVCSCALRQKRKIFL